jgi:DMSO reductase anchor subunit
MFLNTNKKMNFSPTNGFRIGMLVEFILIAAAFIIGISHM